MVIANQKRGDSVKKGLLLVIALCIALSSCARSVPSVSDVLRELQVSCGELPAGWSYRMGAEEGSSYYLPPSVIRANYGEDAEAILGCAEDYAIYVSSFAAPYEIAVFLARTRTHADEIAVLCLARRDLLQELLCETEYAAMADQFCIVQKGRFVIMGLTDDADAFRQAALHAVS